MSVESEQYPRPTGPDQVQYQGKLFEVVTRPMLVAAGKEKEFELARRAPGVRLIILNEDKTKVLLSKEYRAELERYDYRLPGGKVYDTLEEYVAALEAKSDIAEAARDKAVAEGREEVGLDIQELEPFGVSKLGATIEWDLHFFLVTKYTDHPGGQALEDGENIEREWVAVEEAQAMVLDQRMSEERSAIALLRALV